MRRVADVGRHGAVQVYGVYRLCGMFSFQIHAMRFETWGVSTNKNDVDGWFVGSTRIWHFEETSRSEQAIRSMIGTTPASMMIVTSALDSLDSIIGISITAP